MRKAGDVTYADAHKNRKNEGVVEFASRRDMERAIDKFDDYDLNGRRIKVSLYTFLLSFFGFSAVTGARELVVSVFPAQNISHDTKQPLKIYF